MWAKLIRQQLTISDVVLILIVLVTAILLLLNKSGSSQSSYVYVYKNNQLVEKHSISENTTITIDEHNTIQISGGRVRMIKADCPDKRCIKQGWTSRMPIMCLPNELIIEIKNNDTDRKLILQ